MKIIYILRAQYGAGGGAAGFQYASIMNRDHEVLVLEVNNRKSIEKKVSYDEDVSVVDVYADTMLQQVMNVYNEVEEFQPDIIHLIQNPYALHYLYYLKHLTPYAKWIVDFRSPHVGSHNSPALKRYFYLQFYVDKILTHSLLSLKTNIARRFFSAVEITPGLDISQFKYTKERQNSKGMRKFIYIGSISKTRKLDLIIDAFSKLNKLGNSYCLDIFGTGNDYERLVDKVKVENMENVICFKGILPQKKLLKLIPFYDAGIAYVPHEFFDAAPSLKSLEYAASGIPVIASNTSGHREYSHRHGFEFIFFENNVDCLVDTLIAQKDGAYQGKAVRNNIELAKKFDWNYIVKEKLFSVYRDVTGKVGCRNDE